MNKINNTSKYGIVSGLMMLTILSLGIASIMPTKAEASCGCYYYRSPAKIPTGRNTYGNSYYAPGKVPVSQNGSDNDTYENPKRVATGKDSSDSKNYKSAKRIPVGYADFYDTYESPDVIPASYNTSGSAFGDNGDSENEINPLPVISYVNPDSIKSGQEEMTVSIVGYNFTKNSVARWNSSNRPTRYIDSNHLLIGLYQEDIAQNGGYLITVLNPGPGGGFSNSILFTISDSGEVEKNDSNLAASAIGAGFLPTSLVGWILLMILILLLVMFWRKIYVDDKKKNAPLKHA